MTTVIHKPDLENFCKEASEVVWVGNLHLDDGGDSKTFLVASSFNEFAFAVWFNVPIAENLTKQQARELPKLIQEQEKLIKELKAKGFMVRFGLIGSEDILSKSFFLSPSDEDIEMSFEPKESDFDKIINAVDSGECDEWEQKMFGVTGCPRK